MGPWIFGVVSMLAAGPGSRVELFDAGTFLARQVPAGAAARPWLALCPNGAGVELRPVHIELRPFRSTEAKDRKNQRSGREVIVDGCASPLALLRGSGLTPGPVETVIEEDHWKLTFHGQRFGLRRDLPEAAPEDPCGKRKVRFLLRAGATEQLLSESDICTVFTVRWAGDLDGDGKLDLLVAENLDSGVALLRLYLSRGAATNALLRLAASTMHGS